MCLEGRTPALLPALLPFPFATIAHLTGTDALRTWPPQAGVPVAGRLATRDHQRLRALVSDLLLVLSALPVGGVSS